MTYNLLSQNSIVTCLAKWSCQRIPKAIKYYIFLNKVKQTLSHRAHNCFGNLCKFWQMQFRTSSKKSYLQVWYQVIWHHLCLEVNFLISKDTYISNHHCLFGCTRHCLQSLLVERLLWFAHHHSPDPCRVLQPYHKCSWSKG